MLGERIKELRKKHNMTQKDLADLLGVSSSAVGMYEQNRREPSGETLVLICSIFKISLDYLIVGTEFELHQKSAYNSSKDKKQNKIVHNKEFADVVNEMKKQLMLMDNLTFDGQPLNVSDIEDIFEAMKFGASIAFNKIHKNED